MSAERPPATQVLAPRELVELIVRSLVDRPNDVQVNVVSGSQSTIIEVSVHPTDQGKLLGKKGVHADAIRRLLVPMGGKAGRRYVLEIIEPKRAAQPARSFQQARPPRGPAPEPQIFRIDRHPRGRRTA